MTAVLDQLKTGLASQYAVDEQLGVGATATVFLAEDVKHRRRVALKVLRPDLAASVGAERFLREIEIAAGLTHPHILPLHDSGNIDGLLYYVMPYVEGETLREHMTKGEPLPFDEAVQIAREVASALDYAHRKGIVHRDIKPENILLVEGHAVVADFGVARALRTAGDANLTQAGRMVGTPRYMSPEQAMGSPDIDGRTDIYSLGTVVYEMIVGGPPKMWLEQAVLTTGGFNDPPDGHRERLDSLPPTAEPALVMALAQQPTMRFDSAGKFVNALAISRATGTHAAAASIAVLPFQNMSADPDNEYFSDGITEDIITSLVNMPGLFVAARNSSFAFKGQTPSIAEVGIRLHVATVLQGSVRKSGSKLRITAQLVNVADSQPVWSERYDRDMHDVFEIQDEIATTIADKLKLTFERATDQPHAPPPTSNIDAYQLYLKGRYLWSKRTKEGLTQAVDYLERAIDADPAYALAHSGLADAYVLLGQYRYIPLDEARQKGTAAAERAVALAPDLAEGHTSRAQILHLAHDWKGEEAEYRRALEINPDYATAHQWYANLLSALGRHDEALVHIRRAADLDPLSHAISVTVGVVLVHARRYDEAIQQLNETLELEPNFPSVHFWTASAHAGNGNHDEAIAAAKRTIELRPDWIDMQVLLGAFYARAGRKEEAAAVVAGIDPAKADQVALALFNACMGEIDRAFEWLDRAIDAGSWKLMYVNVAPDYDPLRSDPRFQGILRRMNFG